MTDGHSGFEATAIDRGRCLIRRGRTTRSALLGAALALGGVQAALAANPPPVQFFYNPYPETQLLQGLNTIASAAVSPVQTYISIAAAANNTIIYYDQWENGYDTDIANPTNIYSVGNPGGTQIWGDGNPANGAPPGVPSDVINAGTVIVLSNAVPIPRNASTILFDGGDKFAATKTVSVSHVAWATGSSTLMAESVDVSDTNSWGTDYLVPIGANISDTVDFQMFEYTGLAIMAGEGGANIQVDKDANGTFETTATLAQGQGFFINGGVSLGAHVISDKPVQVDVLTGDIGSTYESRDFKLLPTNLWTNSSYEPVSTPATGNGSTAGTATTVWLYNPGSTNVTVSYTTRSSAAGNPLTTTSLTVPGGPHGGILSQVIPNGFGAHFSTSGAPFFAISTTNSTDSTHSGTPDSNANYSGNQAFDWGFTLVPEDSLTPQVLIGLGLGQDPLQPHTEDTAPIWVTPVGNGDTPVTIYVDFDANPATGAFTDPNGNKYDTTLSLKELQRAEVVDPSDGDQTGTLLYTLTPGIKLAAAWGEDPQTASPAEPGLDAGTGIPPLPLFAAGKNGTLAVDNDGDGAISPGDVLLYTISISNISRAPVSDIVLTDNLPAGVTYVANSTFFKNTANVTTPIPDNGVGTPFPLDGSGVTLDENYPTNTVAMPVGGSFQVTFKVTIDDPNLPPGSTEELVNNCSASSGGVTVPCRNRTVLCLPSNCDDQNVCTDDACTADGCVHTPHVGVCRSANGVCDVPESCVGTSCPADGFAASSTVCRSAAGVCDLAETCTGNSAPCPADAKRTAVCRSSAGVCDVAESCDGISDDCPADGFQPSSTVCRSAAGVCDLAESCTGTSAACPPDAKSTALCRSSAGVCDDAETCNGSSNNCPADAFEPSSTTCRNSAGVCDPAEHCTGHGADCPPDAKSTAVCRSSAGVCDVAESCDGVNDVCPPDQFLPSSTVCRSADGVCDVAESCTGGDANCPPDAVHSATPAFVCRSANGVCDVPETCDGTDHDCPSDDFAASGTVCRPAAGACDVPETCTGSSRNCPSDHFAPATQVCRSAAGVCDVADDCTGNGPDCPPDQVADTSTVCRASVGACDAQETCDGVTSVCPPDRPAIDGTTCDDDNPCTDPDTCTNGECNGTPLDCHEVPDDNPCTIDTCNAITDTVPPSFRCDHANCYPPGTQCPQDHPECIPPKCGNGVLDPGETCDPPDASLDPVTGQVNCRRDCTFCGDGVVQQSDGEACDDAKAHDTQDGLCNGLKPVDQCLNTCKLPVCKDPAFIKFGVPLHLFKFHGQLVTASTVDFLNNHFVIELQDANHNVLFRSSLLAGSLAAKTPTTFQYRNTTARKSGGMYKVRIKQASASYKAYVQTYGDLSASVPDMTTHAYAGTDEWAVRGIWTPIANGWKLSGKNTFLPVQ